MVYAIFRYLQKKAGTKSAPAPSSKNRLARLVGVRMLEPRVFFARNPHRVE